VECTTAHCYTMSSVVETTPVDNAPENTDAIVVKVQRTIDGLKAKLKKAQLENTKLKETITHIRGVNSRVRRIPKPAKETVAV